MFDGPRSNEAAHDVAPEAARAPAFQRSEQSGPPLPLEAHVEPARGGWTIRLPVRAEHVTVHKQPVVVEEVAVHVRHVQDLVRLEDTVRREEVRAETEGDLEITQPIEVGRAQPEGPSGARRSGRSARRP